MIHIRLPFKTPTINHLYWHMRKTGIKVMTTEAKKLRLDIEEICHPFIEDAELFEDKRLSVNIWIVENWITLDGKIKKVDIMNREKFLVDSVFKGLGLDDKQIWDITLFKEQDIGPEHCIIQIKEASKS